MNEIQRLQEPFFWSCLSFPSTNSARKLKRLQKWSMLDVFESWTKPRESPVMKHKHAALPVWSPKEQKEEAAFSVLKKIQQFRSRGLEVLAHLTCNHSKCVQDSSFEIQDAEWWIQNTPGHLHLIFFTHVGQECHILLLDHSLLSLVRCCLFLGRCDTYRAPFKIFSFHSIWALQALTQNDTQVWTVFSFL